ncbi:hypothetical protein [Naumannella huperziae]
MTQRRQAPEARARATSGRWAPWWIYLIVLLGTNYLRSYFLPGGSMPLAVTAAIAIGQAVVLFVIITAIWRATRRSAG